MQNQDVQQKMFNLIIGWQQSGQSQKMYCEQSGIRYHVFHYWYKRYRDSQADSTKEGIFIPLQIKQLPPSGKNAGIELLLADGRKLLFNQPVSADFIKAIIS
ncbi:MAG TPA: hypothetical protein VLA25_00125 [Methylotenera sp.]|nr:hypothetical protein [Methylotenera sp.]